MESTAVYLQSNDDAELAPLVQKDFLSNVYTETLYNSVFSP